MPDTVEPPLLFRNLLVPQHDPKGTASLAPQSWPGVTAFQLAVAMPRSVPVGYLCAMVTLCNPFSGKRITYNDPVQAELGQGSIS